MEELVKILWPIVQGATPVATLLVAVLLFLERKERQEAQKQERATLERVFKALDVLRALHDILRPHRDDRP